ncbi:hypothetical protein [Reyranella sp.]|uniref:hypothetical protein n=1 Tax=Reyranella sp. TaxID=1929291 RepID=UPI003BAA4C2A
MRTDIISATAPALASSPRAGWRAEDIIGGEKRPDFDRRFLPESLARVDALDSLSGRERLLLNQIRGHGYLHLVGLAEGVIPPFLRDQARTRRDGDGMRCRALQRVADEEAEHIDLFRRCAAAVRDGFGTQCDVVGPAETFSRAVLAHAPLSVALFVLHLDGMTERHHEGCIRDERGIDRPFARLLRHHWMEEARHATFDAALVANLAWGVPEPGIAKALDGYLEIVALFDEELKRQVLLDLAALMKAGGRRLGEAEHARIEQQQLQAQRWTFIGAGVSHPRFLETVGRLSAAGARRLAGIAPAFC